MARYTKRRLRTINTNATKSRNEQIGAFIMIMLLGSIVIIVQYIGAINPGQQPTVEAEKYNIDTGNLQHDNKDGENVVPLVENRANPNKATNDTPTIGMMAGVSNTTALILSALLYHLQFLFVV